MKKHKKTKLSKKQRLNSKKHKGGSEQDAWADIRIKDNDVMCDEYHNVDLVTTVLIAPRLRCMVSGMKDMHEGGPRRLSREEWYDKLDKMQAAFDILEKNIDPRLGLFNEFTHKQKKRIRKGLTLFAKYFLHLNY